MSSTKGNGNRWAGITRPYTPADVARLRGSVRIEHTLARIGAERLWDLMHTTEYVQSLGAVTGKRVLCLAAGGGRHGPLLASAVFLPNVVCPAHCALVMRIDQPSENASDSNSYERRLGAGS